MRIAQIAPLAESCPPSLYGGTERVVSYLTEELVAQGHDVTLFASGDSVTQAELVSCSDRALRQSPECVDAYRTMMFEQVARRAHEFDILHFHVDVTHANVVRTYVNKTLTTLHGRLDLAWLPDYYRVFSHLPLISISNAQRLPLPPVNWVNTIYHGLPRDLLKYEPEVRGGYLAFLGRISPEKRPDRAIEIAVRTGMPLKIAAKIDRADQVYWEEKIEPLVRAHPNVEYVGEITEREKSAFLGGATALLFPIDWEEPFGLVMIEAMACGTPVVAFRRGSVPEVMDDGLTGYVVDTVDEAVRAADRVSGLSRAMVRRTFEERFTVERMAREYVGTYSQRVGLSVALPQSHPVAALQSIAS